MTDPLAAVLDSLVPDLADERPDWSNVIVRAGMRRSGAKRAQPVWRRRPRLVLAATLLLLLVALLATPAFGVQGLVRDLLGRKNVSFPNSPSAPDEVKKQFEDLPIGAPTSMAPSVIAAQARLVATFSVAGHPRKLWVTPTRRGGYCYTFEQAFGGCRQTTSERNIGGQGQFSVTWEGLPPKAANPFVRHFDLPTRVGGDITTPQAAKITARYADGTSTDIPFIWVSKPIAAGFFSYDIPVSHWNKQHRLLALALYTRGGKLLARQAFPYQHSLPVRLPSPNVTSGGPNTRDLPTAPPVAPTAPLQRGSADGFTVVVGHNGAARFSETQTNPSLNKLVGHSASFGCFRLTKEFGIFTSRGLGNEGRFAAHVGFRLTGVGMPVDGCDIEASGGHIWPDPSAGHSAVEIPLTPVGRRFFADRAAARDLALFIRSRRMHQLRREPAVEALRDMRIAYGVALKQSRIRIQFVDARTLLFSETSSTGKQFRVTVRDGRISKQNIKPYGFVF